MKTSIEKGWVPAPSVRRLTALLMLVSLVGCSGSNDPKLAPVTGRLTFNGEPVANAVVTFRGVNAARYSSGTTDSDGKFSLSTYEPGDGALIGENVVTVAISDDIDPGLSREEYAKQQAKQRNPKAGILPEQYADPKTSGLLVTVANGQNDIPLELPQ